MASVYTPTAVVLGDITIPDDGDTIEASDLNTPVEAVADGVVYATMHGATRLDVLADLTALAALTTPADGLVRHVLGFGMYVFKTAATTGLSPFRVAATDATTGGWVSGTAHQTTLSRLVPCSQIRSITTDAAGSATDITVSLSVSMGPLSLANAIAGDPQGLYPLSIYTGGTPSQAFGFYLPIDSFLVDGATLSSCALKFRPVGGHVALPLSQPFLAICRSPMTGYAATPTSLRSAGAGFVQLAAANTMAYQADQTLSITLDQNNVVDRSLYSYGAVIFDEGGTNALAGNRYAGLLLNMTAIPDARRS